MVSTAALLKHPRNAAQPLESPALGKCWREGNNEVRRTHTGVLWSLCLSLSQFSTISKSM